MFQIKNRLARYAALAAALPAASASADIVWSGYGNFGIASPGSPCFLDLGPGLGEVFRFEVLSSTITFSTPAQPWTTSYGSSGSPVGRKGTIRQINPLFQFNPFNTGGIGDPRFMASNTGNNDPLRLAYGDAIDAGQIFFGPMTTQFSTSHDLAISRFTQGSYTTGAPIQNTSQNGQWADGQRGYIGFNIEVNGADTFGWIDVEWHPYGPARSGVPTLIINGWAYNDTPRGPITAGEIPAPGVFGLAALAMGAAGVRRSRRHVA